MKVIWPACGDTYAAWLPPAWPSIKEAFEWCREQADAIPCGSLAGDVLVWKLAALVQYACTGEENRDHSFRASDLSDLFNQAVVQLQSFPEMAKPYIPHAEEPPYSSNAQVRLIVGHSGAGKTAWVAEASTHTGGSAAYCDVGDTPNPALAATLVRELAATMFPRTAEERNSVLLPGYSGLDSLRGLDHLLASKHLPLCVFLDNTHRADPEKVAELAKATVYLQWVFISQPCPQQTELHARLGTTAEHLQGWNADSVAAWFRAGGIPIDYPVAENVRSVTGGLPLFVQSILALTQDVYNGDVDWCCDDVAEAVHPKTTPQDVILGKVRDRLSKHAREVVALLGISKVPLSIDELTSVLGTSFGMKDRLAARMVRELHDWGVVRFIRCQEVQLHDAFRPIAAGFIDDLGNDAVLAARRAMKSILLKSITEEPDTLRQRFFLRLLPLIGETEALIDVATNEGEFLRELGLVPELSTILREYVDDPNSSARDSFWALDALALWANDQKDLGKLRRLLPRWESCSTLPAWGVEKEPHSQRSGCFISAHRQH